MDKLFQFLNNPANKEKLYVLFVAIGIGMIFNTIKRVMDEIKRRK